MPQTDTDFRKLRLARLRVLMAEDACDGIVVGPSASFRCLVGRNANVTERLICLVITRETATLIVPRLQAPLYENAPYELCIWDEHEHPVEKLALALTGCRAIGVNREFWAGFLLPLQERIAPTQITPSRALDTLRQVKTAEEIAGMERAAIALDSAWRKFLAANPVISGQSEFDLRRQIQGMLSDEGFSEIAWVDVGAGANGASSLHHGSDYVIRKGDPVVIDIAGVFEGWCADTCRVICAGPPEADYLAAYDVVLRAQAAAFEAIRDGAPASAPDAAARRVIAEAGFGDAFTHRVGHGIGLDVHEEPFLVAGNDLRLRAGMAMSDEPGIYLAGRWGIRIEDIVVLTESGPRRLTPTPHDLVILG